MMKIFAILVFFLICFCVSNLFGQEQGVFTIVGRAGVSTSFVSDYQALSINPANLGIRKTFRDPIISVGFLESNITISSEALTRKELVNAIFNSSSQTFSYAEKVAGAKKITDKVHSLDAGIMLFGVSVSLPKFGGFAFSVKDQISFRTKLNSTISEIAFLGANASYFPTLQLSNGNLIDNTPNLPAEIREQVVAGFFKDTTNAQNYSNLIKGSRVAMAWTREFQLGYGNQIIDKYNFSLYGGASIRFIKGIALIDLAANENGLTRSNISMSPSFGLDFGDPDDQASAQSPTFLGFKNESALSKVMNPEPVGNGVGFDFGLNLRIRKRFYFATALTNVGKMNWTGNVYSLKDGKLAEVQGYGYNNYNFFQTNASGLQFAGSKSPLGWKGDKPISIDLPTTLRVGTSYDYFGKIHVGAEIIVPMNDAPGSLGKNFIGVGGDYLFARQFKVSLGFTAGGNQGNQIYYPVGFCYTGLRNFYEMGIATRDILTYFSNTDGSIVSFSTGFLRFKF